MIQKREVVVITGASAGVGRAVAREFGSHGAKVGLLARGRAGLDAAKHEIEEAGGQALAIPTDVSDPEAIERAALQIEREFGDIDIWINVAMTSVFAPVKDMEPEEFKRVTEVTYLGQVYGTLAALKRMLPRDKGSIVLVGSALAYRGIPLQSAYCAAKHAIQGFADSLRCELIHDKSKVKFTMVQLPAVNTTQFDWVRNKLPEKTKPLGSIYQPEVIARGIYWAAHHKRRELMIGWPTIEAIFGNKLAPEYADWVLARKGFKGQQIKGDPKPPDMADNLFSPLDDETDYGSHGHFDDQAKKRSPQLWLSTHRAFAALVAFGLAGIAGLALTRGKNA
jgi:NAD(P)-dependent dehydrogenase (short-subunit alcohol dehydrogenase family)